jgi:choline-glycine betaine transporter
VHDVVGNVAVHRVVDPEVNVTVPVAPEGSPDTDRITTVPWGVEVGFAAAVMVYAEDFVTVKEVVAVDPVKLPSPE